METASGMNAMADSSDCGAEVAEPGSYDCCGRPALQARLTTIGLDPDRKHSEGSVGSAHNMNCAAVARLLASKQLMLSNRRIISELPNTP